METNKRPHGWSQLTRGRYSYESIEKTMEWRHRNVLSRQTYDGKFESDLKVALCFTGATNISQTCIRNGPSYDLGFIVFFFKAPHRKWNFAQSLTHLCRTTLKKIQCIHLSDLDFKLLYPTLRLTGLISFMSLCPIQNFLLGLICRCVKLLIVWNF